jgi:hypothetical protein
MKIVDIALSFVGQKEISGNKGFIDPKFDKQMRGVGFYTGAPWCGFFAILVWRLAGQFTGILSASSRSTINLATKAGNWHSTPVPGAIVVWATFKNGRRQKTGHIGVVTHVHDKVNYSTVEGNTTDKGGREGIMVAIRHRHLTPDKWTVKDGLRLMGFIHPKTEE